MNRTVAMSVPESQNSHSTQSSTADTVLQHQVTLSRGELVLYAVPWLPLQLILLVLTVYLPSFYAIGAGLSMAVVGSMFFVVRLCDVITDTLIGGLSDSWQTRWGRRKPWILAGAPVLLIAAVFLFDPPLARISALYLGVWLFAFYVAYTAVLIPYTAWGADLSTNYVERNRIVVVREAMGTIGIMLGTGLPLIFLHGDRQNLRGVLHIALVAVLVGLPPMVALALVFVRREEKSSGPSPHFSWRTVVDVLGRNPLFTRWSLAYLLHATAWNVFLASMVIIIEYVLGLKNQYLSLVLAMNVTATAGMLLILRIARHIDKHLMIAVGMSGFVIFYGVLSIIPPGHYWMTFAVFAGLGLCFAPVLGNSSAMIPDIVDVAKLRGKKGETGIYMAVYFLLQKLAMALGIGLGLPLLQFLGFSVASPDSASARHAIRVVSLYLPALMTIPAALLFFTYPLDRSRHLIVRKWLDRRASRLRTSMSAGTGHTPRAD